MGCSASKGAGDTTISREIGLEDVAAFPLQETHVRSMTALPGGRIAAGFSDGAVLLWSTAGEKLATLEDHTDTVSALACTPSGDMVSGSNDCTAKVWRGTTCVHTLHGHTLPIVVLSVSPLGDTIVSGSQDYTVKVWSASTGECLATLGGTCVVAHVCVLDDGDVVTSKRRELTVYDCETWMSIDRFEESGDVTALAAFPGGGLAIGGVFRTNNGYVSLWRSGVRKWCIPTAAIGERVLRLAVVHDIVVACCATSVFFIRKGARIKQWNVAYEYVSALPSGSVVFAGYNQEGSVSCKMYRVVGRSRLATIHIMTTAWSVRGGPFPNSQDAAAALARTLSLRPLCQSRVGREAVEVVDPFARAVVMYL